MHVTQIIVMISLSIRPIACIPLPYIAGVSLVPRSSKSIATVYNSSCDQCLCSALVNASVAVNCFLNNNTCQLFAYAPISYRLQSNPQATLYFTNKTLPSPSECCMPNTTLLIQKLQSAMSQSVDFSSPRFLVIDDHGFLASVHEWGSDLVRFDPSNLTVIDTTTFPASETANIAYHQGVYFLSTRNGTILLVNSTNRSLINTISSPDIKGAFDMMFLKDGQIMVVASADNQLLFFFNRSSSSPRDYSFIKNQPTSYSMPHGLLYVNDSSFYVTSWTTRNVYSYATNNDGATWNESLYIDTQALSISRWGAHIMVDDCDRRWLSTSDNGLLIYNTQGQLLGTFNSTSKCNIRCHLHGQLCHAPIRSHCQQNYSSGSTNQLLD